jgi:type I restriction enzyme S subunit
MSQPTLPKLWRWAKLNELAVIRVGTINPTNYASEMFELYSIPGFDNGRSPELLAGEQIRSSKVIVEPGDCLFSKLNPRINRVWIVGHRKEYRQIASTEFWPLHPRFLDGAPAFLPEYFEYLLSWPVFRNKFTANVEASTRSRERLKPNQMLDEFIPLPPLPVQERIVEIFQKADGVLCKRQEALSLADAILSSAFIAMFGDPGETSRGFKVTPLGDLADVRSGVTKGRKLGSKETVEAPYLRVANVQDGYLDLSEVRTIEVLPQDIERYRLEDGDILMIEGCGNPNYLGRGCIWQNQIPGCIHQNHIFRVRTHRGRLLPEFLASLLRTKYANGYFLACAKNSSGLSNINSTQVKAFPVPEPPLVLQQTFVSALAQWEQINRRLTDGLAESKRLFQGLMQRAFTGALTAVWEAAHADEIAAEQARREGLPRLVLLDCVRERQRHRPSEPVLITSLMKYVFLLQKEGTTGQTLYHFVPYKYGPFARELYQDLEALAADRFITVTETDEERTEIAIVPSKETMVQSAVAELPEDLQADIAAVVEQYGDLAHNDLLATVYQKFPAYATKSRLRHYQSR